MPSDWDEIKRLASDFQKVQLTSTLQKLSERNCVEIVQLLIKKELVDVIYTNDGKEYITPKHLSREILDELYVNGGRVNLVEVAKTLNVDLSKINDIAEKIDKDNPDISFMLGQLIDDNYICSIAQEINEKLQQTGEINVSDLTVQFDLPSDFIQQHVMKPNLGSIIKGRQNPSDPRLYFTQAYISRCKSKIRGALAALTRITKVSSITQQINVPEKLFQTIFDDTNPPGTVTSKHSGALYIPLIYAKNQSDWVISFFRQNGFLEYELMTKWEIYDPKPYIKKILPNEDMAFMQNFAIDSKIIDPTMLSALTECQTVKTFVDLSTILPSNLSEADIKELFQDTLKTKNIPSDNFVLLETIAFSKSFLENLIAPCNTMVMTKAKSAVDAGVFQKYLADKKKKDDSAADGDRFGKSAAGKAKDTTGKSKGGRKKNTKFSRKDDNNSDEDLDDGKKDGKKAAPILELVKVFDIEEVIRKSLEEEGLEHLTENIVNIYIADLNKLALEEAQKLFKATPQNNRRQTHASLQEKINTLLSDIRLYEKGVKTLPDSLQENLLKYLLKSLGNEVCNELTVYVAGECNLQLKNTDNLNVDQRNKIAQECDLEYRAALLELNKTVNKSLEEFLQAVDVALKVCSMIVKKVDKKKDRSLILEHKHKLCQQLHETTDHAMTLHLVVLIVFTTITGSIIHASGKFVSQIYSHLLQQANLGNQMDTLTRYHDAVLKSLQSKEGSEEYESLSDELSNLQRDVKEFAVNFEKPGVTRAD